LAAAYAWFAPLPPGTVKKSLPVIVSPATGIRGATATKSMFKLPTTAIFAILVRIALRQTDTL
jgi:hypothetical protein